MANKEKVFEQYNVIGAWFDEMRSRDLKMESGHLEQMIALLPSAGKILDLGCGTGRPIAEFLLYRGFTVKGIDGSSKMVELAKKYVPSINPEVQDMRSLSLNEKFDGIVMWHSSFHLPAADQKHLLLSLGQHLHKKGVLMFTSGPDQGEAWGDNNGESLYHASMSPEECRRTLAEGGFDVIAHTINDPTAGGATVWLCQLKAAV